MVETRVDVVMLVGRYTLLEQPALDGLLPAAQRRGVGVLNVGVFNSGLLAQDWPQADSQLVCTLAASYAQVLDLARMLTADLSSYERSAIFSGTALRTYRL